MIHRHGERVARHLVRFGEIQLQTPLHEQLLADHLIQNLEFFRPGRLLESLARLAFQLRHEVATEHGTLVH